MKWLHLFRESPAEAVARRLYAAAVGQARTPDFYERMGVADTPDGRFDMVVLHVVLLMRRLKRDLPQTADTAQALFDVMFADMDQNLREMGIGDMGVGKRVKAMAQGFYGRLAAYDQALDRQDATALAAALRRNLYRKTEPSDADLAAMAAYVTKEEARLARWPGQALDEGQTGFASATVRDVATPVAVPAAPSAESGDGVAGDRVRT